MKDFVSDLNQLEEPEVLSQELPAIPKYVADWIEECKGWDDDAQDYDDDNAIDLFSAMDLDNAGMSHLMHDWLIGNTEVFARAWLDGYKVEEEQKYVIKLDDESFLQRYEIDNKNIVTPFRIVGHLKEVAIKFDNKEKAEKVAELVEGKVEELE